jgi:hypothetical protein
MAVALAGATIELSLCSGVLDGGRADTLSIECIRGLRARVARATLGDTRCRHLCAPDVCRLDKTKPGEVVIHRPADD